MDDLKSPVTLDKPINVGLHDWKRSLSWRDTEFAKDSPSNRTHPHVLRRQRVLKKHPNIRKLFGSERTTIYTIIVAAITHLLLAYLISHTQNSIFGNLLLLSLSCVIGASIVQLMTVCVHECCHSLASGNVLGDKILGLICNTGTPVPIAMSFRRYHTDHHAYQGSMERDPDLPLQWELGLLKGGKVLKFIWLSLYPILYAIRALIRGGNMNGWEIVNLVTTFTQNFAIVYFLGWRSFLYCFISFYFGLTFHPAAAHFIQEHYTFTSKQETYSYYGPANSLFINVGFHNEHHDFPGISGRFLPILTKLAPEYYQTLYSYHSWSTLLWDFIMDSNMGPESRVIREGNQEKFEDGGFELK